MQEPMPAIMPQDTESFKAASASKSATWALVLGSISVMIPVVFVLVPFVLIFAYGMHKADGDTESEFILYPFLAILVGFCGLGVGSFFSLVLSIIGLMLGIRSQRLAPKAAPVRAIISYVLNGMVLIFAFIVVAFFAYSMVMGQAAGA